MGYRSDVGIALYTKDFNTMIKRTKALKDKSTYELINDADKYTADEDKVTILYFLDIKWYHEFKSVSWIENFIQKINSVFVRTGEDINDNEEICFNEGCELFEYCHLTRMVDIPENKQVKKDYNLNKLLKDIDIDRRL